MSTQGRHAQRHHYGTGAAVVVLAAILAACALLAALFLTAGSSGTAPRTFYPGPRVTAVQPSLAPSVTAAPETAAAHRAHIAHLDHLHAEHVKHLDHLRQP